MRYVLSLGIITLLGGAAATPVTAQAAVPNLTGTWVLQVDKSDFSAMQPPQSRSDVIEHQEPKLTIKRTVVTERGETASDLVYAIDGKPYKNNAGGTELSSTLRWDGATLEMVSTVATPQGEISITDRYTLSPDGKTLTQDRTLRGQGETITQRLLLLKQP